MKYLWTTLQVSDLEQSIAFYRDVVGLELENRFAGGMNIEIAFMKSPDSETKIELIQSGRFERTAPLQGISMGFSVEDLDAKREELLTKGYAPTGITRPNPYTAFFFISDPDGMEVQFVVEFKH